MNKLIVPLLVLFSLSANVEAQYYSFSTDSAYANLPYHYNNLGQVENKLVSFLDAEQGFGIYARDVVTKSVVKLISVDRAMLNRERLISQYFKTPKGLLIDVFGKLYLSDGTVAGTIFIKDFGETYNSNFAPVLVSRIVNIEQVGNSIFVTRAGESVFYLESDYTIWRINLDTGQTNLISDPDTQGLTMITGSALDDSAVAFGYDDSKGYSFWQVDLAKNQPNYINRFEDDQERNLTVFGKGVQSRTGLVVCRASEGYADSSLWRLSRDGRLTRLAESCNAVFGTSSGDKDKFFVTTNDGFWTANGYPGGNVKLLQIGANSQIDSVCVFDPTVVISISSTQPGSLGLSSVTVLDTQSGDRKTMSDVQLIDGCLKNRALLVKRNEGNGLPKQIFVFDERADNFHDVKRTPTSFSVNSPVEIGKDIFFASPPLRQLTFKEGSFTSFLPPIVDILTE